MILTVLLPVTNISRSPVKDIISIYSASKIKSESNSYFPVPAKIVNLLVKDTGYVLAKAYEADKDKPFSDGVPLASTKV